MDQETKHNPPFGVISLQRILVAVRQQAPFKERNTHGGKLSWREHLVGRIR